MIEQYFSEKENDSQKYDFSFISITEDKPKDEELICELQKAILRAYRDPKFLQHKRQNLDRAGLENYILKNVIPNAITNCDFSVRYGDFGEVFASLIIEYIQGKKTFHKLRWKYNSNKSVFGTDILAFDSLNNPKKITYYEVKTRKKALNKEKNEFITVIAYKSLEKDMLSDTETILDFMSRFYFETHEYEKSDRFSDLVDGASTVDKSYEIFVITDSNVLSKNYQQLLSELHSIHKKISPLSVTFVFIDNLKELMTDTWNTIVKNGAEFIEMDVL
ncbi:MAG: hypothetical protein J6K96_11970 [Treponema sp.]|nr:hypothetical protein [Treponema sp.]